MTSERKWEIYNELRKMPNLLRRSQKFLRESLGEGDAISSLTYAYAYVKYQRSYQDQLGFWNKLEDPALMDFEKKSYDVALRLSDIFTIVSEDGSMPYSNDTADVALAAELSRNNPWAKYATK